MSDTTPQIEHEPYCDGWACAACNARTDLDEALFGVSVRDENGRRVDPSVVRIALPPAAYDAVMAMVESPPEPTPALLALMAPESSPVTIGEAAAMTSLLREVVRDHMHGGCRATAPALFAQAGAPCEREPHAVGNHRVSPREGLPGAVWSDARSREDGGS